MILNRLLKNWKKLSPWAKRHNIEAYRLYDHDIPEFPFIVDVYLDHVIIYDKSNQFIDKDKNHLPQLLEAVENGLQFQSTKIIYKKRQRQEGLNQYEKLDQKSLTFLIKESEACFEVNLSDYLDTGLFLDHRPMRQKLFKEIKQFNKLNAPQRAQFLNLFCYTGSVSVFAALGGAQVTSVDMSATYIEWSKRNFKHNHLIPSDHEFIQVDALKFIQDNQTPHFDFIFLDPPTFSNSKRMEESFDVERDQLVLINNTMSLLKKNGILYFSNNKRDFKLNPQLTKTYKIQDITAETIPIDFHNKKIHHCYKIQFSDSGDNQASWNNKEL